MVGTPNCDNGTWGSLSWTYETAGVFNEIDIYHPRYQGNGGDHCTAYYMVNATPGPGATDANVSWYWDGDEYG